MGLNLTQLLLGRISDIVLNDSDWIEKPIHLQFLKKTKTTQYLFLK